MAAVHGVFRSSLSSAPTFVGSAAGDDQRRALVANYYANLMAFLEVHHEGEEELLFPLIAERSPEHAALIEHAAGQHQDVVTLLTSAKEGLTAWELSGDSEASSLVGSLRALNDVLTPHLDQEEAEIVPLAAECVTMEEWGMLPAHGMTHFGGDKVWLILGLIRENMSPPQREAMLANMPPPAKEMWETMGESSFNDMIAQVRQSAG